MGRVPLSDDYHSIYRPMARRLGITGNMKFKGPVSFDLNRFIMGETAIRELAPLNWILTRVYYEVRQLTRKDPSYG